MMIVEYASHVVCPVVPVPAMPEVKWVWSVAVIMLLR